MRHILLSYLNSMCIYALIQHICILMNMYDSDSKCTGPNDVSQLMNMYDSDSNCSGPNDVSQMQNELS